MLGLIRVSIISLYFQLRQLEDIRCGNRTPKSSCASTPSSGTLTSDCHASSVDFFSPKNLEKHCRPMEDVIMETELKGTLIERLVHVEDRVLKVRELIIALCLIHILILRLKCKTLLFIILWRYGIQQLASSAKLYTLTIPFRFHILHW